MNATLIMMEDIEAESGEREMTQELVLFIHEKKTAALMSGFVQIMPEEVTIMAEVVEWPDEIDENRAKEAKTRAERRIQSHDAEMDVARAELALKRALVRLEARQ